MSDTARPVSDVMHRIWISALLFGALAAILGVAMLVWPGPSIVVAAALFGAYLVLSGVAMVVLAFALPAASGAGRVLYFLSGAISVILGIAKHETGIAERLQDSVHRGARQTNFLSHFGDRGAVVQIQNRQRIEAAHERTDWAC